VGKNELVRFVLLRRDSQVQEEATGEKEVKTFQVTVDPLGLLPGRGAYCHRNGACLLEPKLWWLLIASWERADKQRRRAAAKQTLGAEAKKLCWETVLGRSLEVFAARSFSQVRRLRVQVELEKLRELTAGREAPEENRRRRGGKVRL
jgi:predicted RNA-binding protein YlxR (DUF448 family)